MEVRGHMAAVDSWYKLIISTDDTIEVHSKTGDI